jgi:hypothetical protein
LLDQGTFSETALVVNWFSDCRKNVRLTGFRCRCSDLFLSQHDCSYDYKAAGREAIVRENTVIRGVKIVKVWNEEDEETIQTQNKSGYLFFFTIEIKIDFIKIKLKMRSATKLQEKKKIPFSLLLFHINFLADYSATMWKSVL